MAAKSNYWETEEGIEELKMAVLMIAQGIVANPKTQPSPKALDGIAETAKRLAVKCINMCVPEGYDRIPDDD